MDAKFDGILSHFKDSILNYVEWQRHSTNGPLSEKEHEMMTRKIFDDFKMSVQNHIHERCLDYQRSIEDQHRNDLNKYQTQTSSLDVQLKLMMGQYRPPVPDKRVFPCHEPQCGKTFATEKRLKIHLKLHATHSFVFCPVVGCGKAFPSRYNLQQHTVFHTGERHYSCSEPGCDKKFFTKGNLKQHERIHTGEKPFVCERCFNSFAQSWQLRRHKVSKCGYE